MLEAFVPTRPKLLYQHGEGGLERNHIHALEPVLSSRMYRIVDFRKYTVAP